MKLKNNISIETLMQDYKQQCFDVRQLNLIYEGLVNGLDVSIYAKPIYDTFQMYAIKRGLEEGLDVQLYTDPSLSVFDMAQIYDELLGAEEGTLLRQIFGSR